MSPLRARMLLAEEEVRRYLLDVRERNARGSFKTSHYGIQFFYRNTLGQDWALFKKRSGFPSRGGCRRRFPMPKCGAFSPRSAIPYTADRGHEAGRLGGHDPGDLPPGGQVSGEALQSVAGADQHRNSPTLPVRQRAYAHAGAHRR